MFKPAKLSSALTENATTPEKLMSEKTPSDVQIDITLDLSQRDLEQVPDISSLLSQRQQPPPSIIDLRKNKITAIPIELFQIPTLKVLKIDQNQVAELPSYKQGFDPALCRLTSLSICKNKIQALPDWFYSQSLPLRRTLERLDISCNNPPFIQVPDQICIFENLKQLHLQGNKISTLPCAISRLTKIEEFGLEWWQYIVGVDEINIGKKIELGMMRDESIVTNRQTIRQIFEGFRLVNQSNSQQHQSSPPQRIKFCSFYRLYKRSYSPSKGSRDDDCRIKSLFQIICLLGHDFLMKQLIQENPKLNMNLQEQKFQGQTLLQVALQTSESPSFLESILAHIARGYANFEVYLPRPNEELPLQRQLQLLHPLMISLKRKMIKLSETVIDIMQADAAKSKAQCLSLDIKDENRNSIFHLAFQYFQDEELKSHAIKICKRLVEFATNKNQAVQVFFNDINKQGMTPLDLAIELKINDAVDFVLDCNQREALFDTNANLNQRGLTPLHRAVQAHNHYALFRLLKSGRCNALIRDKDFKKARDYCQRMLFMQKMLKMAEQIEIFQVTRTLPPPIVVQAVQQVNQKILKVQDFKAHENQRSYEVKRHQSSILGGANGRNIKRSVSTDLPVDQDSKFKSTIETAGEKRPFQIEKPMPIERGAAFNRTIVDSYQQEVPLTYNISPQDREYGLPLETEPHKKQKHTFNRAQSQHMRKVSQIKPRLAQPHPHHLQSQDQTSPGFIEDEPQAVMTSENNNNIKAKHSSSIKRGTVLSGVITGEISNFDTFVIDDADASEDSPSILPSKKFQYVMTVNNSKLSRRPYYKKIVRNTFEEQFCQLMESPSFYKQSGSTNDYCKKAGILYYVYSIFQSTHDLNKKRDAREFFTILTQELFDPIEGVLLRPLTNEVLYLNEKIHHECERLNLASNVEQELKTTPVSNQLSEVPQKQVNLGHHIKHPLAKASTPNQIVSRFTSRTINNTRDSLSTVIEQPAIILKGHDFASNISRLTDNNGGGGDTSSQTGQNSKIANPGLVLMKTLRQSVSLNQLIQGIKINAQNFSDSVSIEEQLRAFQGKRQTMSYNYYKAAHSQQVGTNIERKHGSISHRIKEHSKFYFEPGSPGPDKMTLDPTSPRGNSGQIDSKHHVMETYVPLLTKTAEKRRPTFICDSDQLRSPNQGREVAYNPSISEYSITNSSQQVKRKQNLQVLDSSVRTVQINIDDAFIDVPLTVSEHALNQPQLSEVGQHLKNRHSKMMIEGATSKRQLMGSIESKNHSKFTATGMIGQLQTPQILTKPQNPTKKTSHKVNPKQSFRNPSIKPSENQLRSQSSTKNRGQTFSRPNLQAKFLSGFTSAASAVSAAQNRLRQQKIRREQRSIEGRESDQQEGRNRHAIINSQNNPGS